jgi:exosome complex component RRP40
MLPGDTVGTLVEKTEDKPIRVGPGLTQVDNRLIATKAGTLRFDSSTKRYFLENNQKRYVPLVGDMVVGVIKDSMAETFRVDIGFAQPATLSNVGFDGAMRRNRPDLHPGDLVYARVIVAHKDMEPEITCLSAQGTQRKDWVTGQSVFGPLKGGYVTECSLALSRRLLDPNCSLLKTIGDKVAFELAVGMNGKIWITSDDNKNTILIANALQNTQHLNSKQIDQMLETLFK